MLLNWLRIRWPVGYTKASVYRQLSQRQFNWISHLCSEKDQPFFIGSCFHSKKGKLRETFERFSLFSTKLSQLLWGTDRNYVISFFVEVIMSMVNLDYNSWNTKMVSDFIILWSYSTRNGHLPISLCATLCLPYIELVRPGMIDLDIVTLRTEQSLKGLLH